MTNLQTRYYCHNPKEKIHNLLTTKRPTILSDYNQIYFIAIFPQKLQIC